MSGKPIEIWCIDDDPDDLEIFGEALLQTALEADVKNILNDSELFRYFKSTVVPDVIFLDGSVTCHYENNCLEEIKSQRHLTDVPVIILSTIGGEQKVNDMYRRGAALFLIKPSTLGALSSLLKVTLTIDWRTVELEKVKEDFSEHHPEMKFPKTIPTA